MSRVEQATLPSAEELQTRIDEVGFGFFQVVALIMTGGIMFSEGSEMIIMGSITTLLHDRWELSAFLRGFMVSVVFIGFAVGNLISGKIGDHFGRRPAILLAYALIGTFGLLTAVSFGPATMTSLRFIVGVGCGIGFPSVYAMIPEVCPKHLRGVTKSLMIGFMPLGEAFGAIGVILIDKNLTGSSTLNSGTAGDIPGNHVQPTWRGLCEYSAMPAFFFFVLASCFLYESPHFLRSSGRAEELNKVLSAMDRYNSWGGGVTGCFPERLRKDSVEKAVEPFSWQAAVASLFGDQYLCVVLVLFIAHFTKDFGNFGLSYAFPQYFAMLAGERFSVGHEMLICSLLATPGVLLAALVMHAQVVGKVGFMVVTSGLCGVMALGLLESSPINVHVPSAFMLKILVSSYFIATVIFTAESFPVQIRNTALGICTCVGRLGSILAPIFFELSANWFGGFDAFWVALSILMIATAVFSEYFLSHYAADEVLFGIAKQGKNECYGSA